MQHELFSRSNLDLSLEAGRNAPRLWVRRLVIWKKPDEIVRDISLKPGLNIVWSPDPEQAADDNDDQPIGHGSGKTTFCRLLRYCMGEDSFAPEGQRNAIWTHFAEGMVGAEIMLDGRKWISVRSLGNKKRDFAIEDGEFAAVLNPDAEATGMEPLRTAITTAIIGNAARLMPPSIDENQAWEAALAWLTRDQECRFSKFLDWRSADSKSHSPIQGRSADDMLAIVRSLIGALTAEELETKDREKGEEQNLARSQAELSRLEWQCERTRAELAGFFGQDHTAGSDLDASGLKEAANNHYAKVLKLPAGSNVTDLEQARQKRDEERENLNKLQAELAESLIRIDEKKRILTIQRSRALEAHTRLNNEGTLVCNICMVPIDTVLAQGCNIKVASAECDLSEVRKRYEDIQKEITEDERIVKELEAKKPVLNQNIALSKQRLQPLENAVSRLEADLLTRSKNIRSAERLVDNADRYERLILEKAKMQKQVDTATASLKTIRDTLGEHRANVAEIIRSLSTRFDAILKELIAGAKGEVKLDGNGLSLKVELGGERSTAAIESLKVVAFDLAVLTLSMEGKTFLPAFLLHDSPREADLGKSIYNRLFTLPGKLEKLGSAPVFQYIITSTTAPPEGFQADEWLKLKINGSPAGERLLKTDL